MDFSQDFMMIDDPITVQYLRKTAEGTWAAGVPVCYCQRLAITKEDAAIDPLVQKDGAVFHLWKANLKVDATFHLPTPTTVNIPKIGDKIAHGGSNWIIRSVGELDRDSCGVQRYRCVCTRSTS